jgi:hypothetical protein
MNGRLGISASRVLVVNGGNSFQRMGISLENVQTVGTYLLTDSLVRVGSYENFDTGCKLSTSPTQSGTVVITRLDPVARIAAGRFSFTLEKPGCGRVEVTEGRFDTPF